MARLPPELVADRIAVVETVDRLFVLTDRKDWDGVRALFAPQVLFDMTSLAGGEPATLTPQQIVDGWREGLKDVEALQHLSGNHLVTVRGTQAEVHCYANAAHWRPGAERRVTTFVGSYDFRLARTPDGWVISQFRFDKKWVE